MSPADRGAFRHKPWWRRGFVDRRPHHREDEVKMAHAAGHHEQVEELVCLENSRPEDWPAQEVENGSQAVSTPPATIGIMARWESRRAISK